MMLCLGGACLLFGADARKLARDAARAARDGDYVRAFALYSQAAQQEPYSSYAAQSRAMLAAARREQQVSIATASGTVTELPAAFSDALGDLAVDPDKSASNGEDNLDELTDIISPADLAETRQPLPPIQLEAGLQRTAIDTRAPRRRLWEEVLRSYGLEVIFDQSIRDEQPVVLELEDADYREAIRALELVTGTNAYVVTEKLLLVAPDDQNAQNRLEPTVAVAIPIPMVLRTEDATEIANALRQALEIRTVMVDGERRLLLLRDRYARVLLAQVLAEELMAAPQDVVLEIELREVNHRSLNRYGIQWQTEFPVTLFRTWLNNRIRPVEGVSYLTFSSNPLVGIGIGASELVAFMSRNDARTLYRAELRTGSGKEAELNLGQQYPVIQQSFLTAPTSQPGATTFFPQVQFRQLGASFKATPTIWRDVVTLDFQATVELLTGESVNGIPVFSNREVSTRFQLREGQTVAVSGLLARDEAVSLTGLAGLASLPGIGALFRQTTTQREETDLLILVTPRVLHPRSVRGSSPTIYTGTATRFLAPL